MTTRRDVLLLLRKHPGITVTELAGRLRLTNMGVRRHLETLGHEGLIESTPAPRRSLGRPPTGWRLSATGDELFPRRYDRLAVEVLEDMAEEAGEATVEAALARRTEKVATQYEAALDGAPTMADRVMRLAALRDGDGYLAEWAASPDGDLLLTENNCAILGVARRFPVLCAMEHALFRRCLGPEAEVTRVAHTLAGDAVCCYRIRPSGEGDARP